MGKMIILEGGHREVAWDQKDQATVDAAAAEFAAKLLEGHLPVVDGAIVREFDPAAEEIRFVLPLAGG